MCARTRRAVVAMSIRVIAPGVDPCPFLSGHTMTPPGVFHAVVLRGNIYTLLETDVTQTFHGGHISDMCPRGIRPGIMVPSSGKRKVLFRERHISCAIDAGTEA
jgi:hypothetical protein